MSSSVLRSFSTELGGMSATPDSKRIGGTMSFSFTVFDRRRQDLALLEPVAALRLEHLRIRVQR